MVVLNDRTFNAFVMDGRHIFINAGALFDAKTPNEIIGVLAHETGHLAGGHLMRLREKLAQAQTQSIVAMLLGVGAMVAGATAGRNTSVGELGGAAIMAPQSAILHSLLAYARTQEDQADHAGVKFLNATHQSPRGMVDLFKRLSNEMLFNSRNADPYLQTHPMPADRVAALEVIAKAKPLLGRQGPAAIAAAPRSDARQIVRLPGARRHRGAALSARRSEPAGALCARHLHLPACRSARGHRADRRADPAPSPTILISTSSRARRCWKAGTPRKPSPRYAARCSSRITPR